MDKHYSHLPIEEKWYQHWERSGAFKSEVDRTRQPYCMVIPPPNVTGMLHMGHVLNNTIQDILARTKRMQGFNVCWVPGTDHAGIATQNMVEKALRADGVDPDSLSREEFLKKVWEWKDKFGGIIIQQLRKLGSSCDWDRERFTMDEGLSHAVLQTFVDLYHQGLIYRGKYIVNWCPALQTALSDDEVDRSEEASHLWHFRYPLSDGSDHLVVATTRPETMLGDTGVAVHPEDERYQHLIGKFIRLPIVGREIPIVADEHVDPSFGTGCVKVTPAHDMNDFEMGTTHNLEFIVIMDRTAHMNEQVPEMFQGMDRNQCRKAVVAEMDRLGLLEKTEPHTVAVGRCYRTKDIIEPYLSEQWFIRMEGMAQRALVPVQTGAITFYPDRWVKTYEHWLTNIKDWCISRQLKWGHRIPVWYCPEGHQTCAVSEPVDCATCHSPQLTQDEDVLDTWASSWLWPFSVFGWPDTTEDLKYYYPTTTLVTAADIIFFWVARMIMAGQQFMGEVPFRHVYFNGIVRDLEGRKMSKTLGNSPDPLDIIREYGADALRFTIVYQTPFGADSRFSAESCDLGRGFCTKIWNAYRFVDMSFEGVTADENWMDAPQDLVGRWILSRLSATVTQVTEEIEAFKLANAASTIYNFFWGEFCDWYVEFLKPAIREADDAAKAALLGRTQFVVDACLRLLHPFMPFVTEEIWQSMQAREGALLGAQTWPKCPESWLDIHADQAMDLLQSLITAIRGVRKSNNLPNSAELSLVIDADERMSALVREIEPQIRFLGRIYEIGALGGRDVEQGWVPLALTGLNAYLDLRGHLDVEAEIEKIDHKLQKMEKEIQGLESRLGNENFVARAPEEVVAKCRADLESLHGQRHTLLQSREDFLQMGSR
ncbi:MAG: valine--tRNA ligase [Acidobacteria bacterium]|nr:valine--tRNA ligase [Acidobacteriota bacterium]